MLFFTVRPLRATELITNIPVEKKKGQNQA